MVRDYLRDLSQSRPSRGKRHSRSQSLSELESDRLLAINSRSTCITFLSTRKLPYTEDLLTMCPSHPAQSVVVGPHQQLWCFLVFPSIWDREMAEKQLYGSKYKGGDVVVNWNRKMVPMAEDDLDRSRQMTCLAVHGISAGTSKRDLETAFPDSVSVTIARRGGTAFLQFRDTDEAEREFRGAEGMVVRGCSVVVMYSHSLVGRGSHKEDLRGVLSRKRVARDCERKMRDYGERRLLAHEDKGSSSRSRFYMKRRKSCSRSRSRSSFNIKRGKPCSRSRSRSSLLRRKTRRHDPDSTFNRKIKDVKVTNVKVTNGKYKERSSDLKKAGEKLCQDDFLSIGDPEDRQSTGSLVAILASSPVKKEVHTPVRDDRSMSFTLSPSPILSRKSSVKSKKSSQPEIGSSISNSSAEYGPLYRMLVTQLVGVGLSGKMAHGRAADIVNLWAETGYKVDQLRKVLARYRGKQEQRKELCRIVKEKCRRKARKMNIDIVAMVDITIAFLVETEVKQEKVNEENDLDISEFSMLSKYLEKELTSLGMKMISVNEEIIKVVKSLSKLRLSPERMEAKYICTVGDTQMGGLAEFHLYLEKKLTEVGFNGKYLSPRLAAGLVMEFFQGMERVKEVVERNKKVFAEVDICLSSTIKLLGKTPAELHECIKSTPIGFPRMGVVVACRLLTICRMSEEECRVLAREMVGVWVNYGFDYVDIRHMYEKGMLGLDKKDNISLMDMRRLLHCRLRAKIEQGFAKPTSFGFSKLIDLTIFYFENTA